MFIAIKTEDGEIKGKISFYCRTLKVKMLKMHCQEKWILMYTERCLKSPVLMPDKTVKERNSGTPQGGVISPVLENLFMHYAFDSWMKRKFLNCPWERYADDGIIHCATRKQAEFILDMLREQMQRYGLEIHPEKSKIVYCRADNEPVPEGVETSFVFLGYCFRPRLVRWLRRCRKKVKGSYRKAQVLLNRIALTNPKMFPQWQAGYMPM